MSFVYLGPFEPSEERTRRSEMSDRVEWRRIYDRPTAFLAGIGIGDCYRSKGADEADVWRVRVWNPDRVEGGRQQYVLPPEDEDPEEFAKQHLVAMLERAKRESGE